MNAKIIGYIIVGVGAIIGFITYLYNKVLEEIVAETCSHGPTCVMVKTLEFHNYVSLSLMGIVLIIGLFFIFFYKGEVTSTRKKINKEDYENEMKDLKEEEKTVLSKVIEAEGTIFQSDIVEKTNFPKAKITRILDRLEAKDIIERKRRGMTNVVILK